MKNSYSPKKLVIALEEVKRVHSSVASVSSYNSSDFINLLKKWVNLGDDELEDEAVIIPTRYIKQLIEYIPSNSLKLPVNNLYKILELRMTDSFIRRLFDLWQTYFENKEYNNLMLTLSSVVKPIFNVYLQNSYLKLDVYQKWISSGNDYIPSLVGREILRIKNLNRFSFDESMRALLIKPDTRIGRECVESFYTFCEKHDYLAIDDSELKDVVSRYDIKKIHAFMHNMLDKLEVMDFQKFYFTGSFIRDNYTGEKGSIRYDTFFSNYTEEEKDKYHKWLAYIFIRANINDERVQFWNNYVANWLRGYEYFKASDCLVFSFKSYCVLEFTNITKGPLYIYELQDFLRRVRPMAQSLNNKDLRSYLYRSSREKRIEHQKGWQNKADYFLRANNLMFK